MNILKNPLFWLPVLVAALVAGFFYSKNKNIFSAKNNTNFVQTSNVDNASIDITFLWKQIWQQGFKSDYSIAQTTKLIKSMWDQINADIFQLLEKANNKSSTLNWFLSLAWANISDSKNILASLRSQSQKLQKISTDCENQKTQYDKDFFNWLKNNEAETLVNGFEWSKKAWSCSVENRVEANAYKLLADKLENSQKILTQKYDLLNKNKTLIVENYELFKENNLEQLLQVKNSFKNLNSNTPNNWFWIQFPNIF